MADSSTGRKKWQGLTSKFVVPIIAVLLVFQVASMLFLVVSIGSTVEDNMMLRGQGLAESFASISAGFIVSHDFSQLQTIADILESQAGIEKVRYTDENGNQLAVSNEDMVDENWLEFSESITLEGTDVGILSIWLSQDSLHAAKAVVRNSLLASTLLLLIAISISLILLFRRIVSGPLNKITTTAQEVALGNLAIEISTDRHDEIGDLALAFEDMIKSLKLKTDAANEFAIGNLEADLAITSDGDVLGKAMITMRDTIIGIIHEMNELVVAITAGRLNERTNPDEFTGEYQVLLQKLNELVGSLVGHIDGIPTPVSIIDKDRNFLYINDVGARLNNRRSEDLIGTRCFEHFKTTDCNTERCAVIRAMRSGEIESSEAVACPAGQDMDISITGKPFFDQNGDLIAVTETVMDQTKVMSAQRLANMINEFQKTEISKLSEVLYTMASGDLTSVYEVDGSGGKGIEEVRESYAEIASVLGQTLSSMNDTLKHVQISTNEVRSGADQVASASQALSQGATEQAASLEEISATLTEIAFQTKENSESASEANTLAKDASHSAGEGNQRMDEMLESMQDIESQSLGVQKIIKVIDEIAFQTNLLALNAAVEAARAGVHGKGFAVVAEEVRNLAQRSARAASETNELIDNSVNSVKEGSKIANETAKSFKEIVVQIDKISNLASEISDASNDQASGISEVSEALTQVDIVTQSNTATAEQSAAAAEELSGQAEQLRQMMGRFILTQSSGSRDMKEIIRDHMSHSDPLEHNGHGRGTEAINVSSDGGDRPSDMINLDDDDFDKF